jgi:hypothetical protein
MIDKIFEYIKTEVNEKQFQSGIVNNDTVLNEMILDLLYDQGKINMYYDFYYYNESVDSKCFGFSTFNNKIILYNTVFSYSLNIEEKIIHKAHDQLKNFFSQIKDSLYRKINEAADYYDSIYTLTDYYDQYQGEAFSVEYRIITNADTTNFKKNHHYEIYDINDIKDLFFSSEDKSVQINFYDYNLDKPISCVSSLNGRLDVYLFMIPGYVLAKMYDKYHHKLLDKNIRYYLDEKGAINKGIMKTLKDEPGLFSAYNNGLSCVCSGVEIDEKGNIHKISDFQIVNGGQTTASLHSAYEKEYDIAEVNVQVKLTRIKNIKDLYILPNIARYANTQNTVQIADHHANELYLKELERLSRQIEVPTKLVGAGNKKWFFERARGQFLLEKTFNSSINYDDLYPKNMRFDKLDLAKFAMSWEQYPYEVSKGRQRNFNVFMTILKSNSDNEKVTESIFKDLVSLNILFKSIDYIVKNLELGFKSQVVTYSLAKFSFDANKKINLEKIWNEQDISIELQNYFVEQTKQIYRALVESLSNQKDPNLSTWAKKRGCWDYIKGQNFIINIPSQYVTTSQRNILVMIEGELLDKSPDYWFALSKWGKESGQLTSFERRIVFSMGKITIKNNKPSAKQFSQLEKIYNKVKELDFDSYFEELKIDI